MRLVLLGTCLTLPTLVHSEMATGLPAANDGEGRFQLSPAQGGFVRLDRKTGAMSFCVVEQGSVQCRAGADERAALQDEIDRLAARLDRLGGGDKAGIDRSSSPRAGELDRLTGFVEDFYRRFLDVLRGLDLLPKENRV